MHPETSGQKCHHCEGTHEPVMYEYPQHTANIQKLIINLSALFPEEDDIPEPEEKTHTFNIKITDANDAET
eukprot:15365183-Ditylum_brightwellii.AAC.2